VSKWAGKFVIGLTGNIGTGKSVVRKMLEHLGAYGVDADALAHRAIAKGAPGYAAVLRTFGQWLLGPDEQIDRVKLGRLVFNDPEAMHQLEAITHPLVEQAVDYIVQHATQSVIAIEAIKLLESNLGKQCDSIWVTYASPEQQVARLTQQRKMSEADARMRIQAQGAQDAKLNAAHVVIKNVGSFEDTWRQVNAAWQKVLPQAAPEPEPVVVKPTPPKKAADQSPTVPVVELSVVRAGPRNSNEIANLLNRLTNREEPLAREDIMAAFGEKAFLLLQAGQSMVGVIGWQVENLVSRTLDIVIDPAVSAAQALPVLINEMERASKDLQCEASLVFAPPELAQHDALWRSLGYERRSPQMLGILAWQEAAQESMLPDSTLYFKKLRQDRILRPI
jgi:dephospho-CoA kinase